ncbi:ATP-grasp domain-containing protein [Algibacter amylolyticus]|uniref:ATP-grasp domain-containing protein n=1 Tax=Algibacter amylolyticus TaxID=1608400 RepID=A0A5M7B893_9FLAO|nr:ATP-grasp domain-containing protein [Algibacter amylolyticus]KAA5825609.1 ATP-grasp domain-containing protein [Algibacter amylolyticus]MBB5268164.1 putative ATP-grasp superfamily ATP-dependent carboligase [Algibacter amylolyticus]TSJ79907.1 ATP-grasp domain-containing protein [Algibacter amylolyticus]
MPSKNISILIPDGEAPVLMIVLNCLSEIKRVKIHVMSDDADIPMKHSKKVYKFYYRPKTESDVDYISNINDITENQDIDLIMPIFEHSIRLITKYKDLIRLPNKLALLPSHSNFEKAINKGTLTEYLKTLGLPYPKSQVIAEGLTPDLSKVDYPILIKPIESPGGGLGIKVFKEESEFLEFLNSNDSKINYLVQDYIEGYDIDCSVLCKNGEVLAYTIQKPNMFGGNKFAPQISFKFVKQDDILNQVKTLMKSLDWSGVAHLDMRFDEKAKNFKVVEINPRFWGSVEASLFAGINFPYLYYLSSLNKPFETPDYKLIDFMLLKGLVKSIKRDKSQLLKLKFIFNNTPIKYMLSDLKPTIYRTSSFILRKLNLR